MSTQEPIVNIELSIMCPKCEELFSLTPIYNIVQLYGWKQCPHCKYQWYLGLQTIVKREKPKKTQCHITPVELNLWTPLITTFKRILGINE